MEKTMASKGKTGANATEALEQMVTKGTDTMKQNFDKVMGGYDKLTAFSKENVDALIKASNAATKGIEAINSEILAFSKQSVEDSVAAAKAALSAKSVQEFVELNTDFSKSAFDQYIGQVTKVNEMIAATARESAEPLKSRFTAFVSMVRQAQPAL